MMGGMGIAQVVRCDGGCGAQADVTFMALSLPVTVPEGWKVRNVSVPGILDVLTARTVTVCPECWPVKTLAEVLGP